MWQKTYRILKINFSVVESDGHVLGNGFVRRGEQLVTSHKTMNLSLDSQLMYYIHNVFTQYVILLNIAEKDHNRTEVGVAKTPLETTRLLNPVYIEEFFRKELFLCENCRNTVPVCFTNYTFLKILENSQEKTCVSF